MLNMHRIVPVCLNPFEVREVLQDDTPLQVIAEHLSQSL